MWLRGHKTKQAHNIETTSIQRWSNVLTLNQHWIDVVSTVCACWEFDMRFHKAKHSDRQAWASSIEHGVWSTPKGMSHVTQFRHINRQLIDSEMVVL